MGGCARSGTTLLLSILSAHPEIYAIPILTDTFCLNVHSYKFKKNIPFGLVDLAYFYYKYFNKIPSSYNRWCEKTPMNVRYFDKIIKYFNAKVKIIYIVRDGRDVILSILPEKPNDFQVSPERWISDVSIGLKYINNPNVYTVKYEDLVMNYEETIKKICTFLDIECDYHLLNWHKFTKIRTSRAWSGEIKEIFQDSVGKWKKTKYKERVEELMQKPKAIELLKKLGYLT